jgi:hypothetical protein
MIEVKQLSLIEWTLSDCKNGYNFTNEFIPGIRIWNDRPIANV